MRAPNVLLPLLCWLAAPAQGGPWAREPGDVFLSYTLSSTTSRGVLSQTGMIEPDTTHSFYGEVGLGYRLTLGADVTLSEDSGFRTAFVRYTLTAPERVWQASVNLGGAEQQQDDADDRQLLRFGAAIGRGFGPSGDAWPLPIGHGGGWAVLKTTGFYDPGDSHVIWQVETTLGLSVTERWRGMVSVLAEDWEGGELIVTARPSALYALTERTTVRFGAHAALSGDDDIGVVLGLWQEF